MKEIGIEGLQNNFEQLKPPEQTGRKKEDGGFEKMLVDSIRDVNKLQLEANRATEQLAAGTTESIHETMIAMQKANISFQMMMQIRNKIIDAYQEIMKSSM